MKTEKTKQLEQLLKAKFNPRNDFFVFECTIGWYGNEIVDCICYNCQREFKTYEIKQSKQDFHSDNALSFVGHKNYLVMPYSLYKEVEQELWNEKKFRNIGVYVAIDHLEEKEKTETNEFGVKNHWQWCEPVDGMKELYCIKNARSMDLHRDKEVLLSSMIRSMQRELYKDKESRY